MKIAVLDAATLGSDLDLSPLSAFGEVSVYQTTAVEETKERVEDADVIVINKFRCNAETLCGAKRLCLICVAATGFDNIDLSYCRARGIAVCNVVGYSTHSVAQLTLAMVLSLSTKLSEYDAFTKNGAYSRSGAANAVSPVFHELCGKTWGVFGLGNIGRQVAKVAEAMGCRVLVCKRTPAEGYSCVSFDELCKQSDVLTLHSPLNDQTRGILNGEKLALMKKNAILVNVARGAVVDEAAVAEAIRNGRLGGFGCDVYSTEPYPVGHPYESLAGCSNVILTPHMAWGAYEARERCLAEICENIKVFFDGGVRNRVDL